MFERHSQRVEQLDPSFVRGTSLQREIVTSWDNLRSKLGPEHHPNYIGNQTSTQWVVRFAGNIFTVYDYKVSDEYDKEGTPVSTIRSSQERDWHVGGHSRKGVDEFVRFLLEPADGKSFDSSWHTSTLTRSALYNSIYLMFKDWRTQRILEALVGTEKGKLPIDELAFEVGDGSPGFLKAFSFVVREDFIDLDRSHQHRINKAGRKVLDAIHQAIPAKLTEAEIEYLQKHPSSLRLLKTVIELSYDGKPIPVKEIEAQTRLSFKAIAARLSHLQNHRLIESRGLSHGERTYFLSERGVRNVNGLKSII